MNQVKIEEEMALEDKIQDLSLKQIEIKKQELNILKTSENITLTQQLQDQEKKSEDSRKKSEKIQSEIKTFENISESLKANLSDRKSALEA